MTQRNSSLELLRILSILGILYMHMLAEFGSKMQTGTQLLRVCSDSLFNAGVTCFVLISGYFGIKRNIKKLIYLDLMVIFYDIIGLVLYAMYGQSLGAKNILSAIFPIISGRYWFLSCYFFLALLAPYIEILLDHINKAQAEQLILLLLILFYAIPTFLYFQLMHDEGKGLVNMFVMYIIGRYFGKYKHQIEFSRRRLLVLFLVNLALIIGLNLVTGKVTGSLSTIWSRDCSLFILISALLIFGIFLRMEFRSSVINRIAESVLALYVLSPYVQFVMEQYIPFESYDGKWYLPFVIAGLVMASAAICIGVDQARKGMIKLFVSCRRK